MGAAASGVGGDGLLGPADVRGLAVRLGLRPTKTLGQNFVHDPNTVRRIVRLAGLDPGEPVLEVGPGLGSLTLGLLATDHPVVAVEIDPLLAAALVGTVAQRRPDLAPALTVVPADAMRLDPAGSSGGCTALVANLPYNVSVPVLLHLLASHPRLRHGLVMVQQEVAARLVAGPGSRVYGAPSVKAAWFADLRRVATVPRSVFWPVPNVDSALVGWQRRPAPDGDRAATTAVIDAAFGQRRKTLRGALAGLAGGPDEAARALQVAGVDPGRRGESLTLGEFVAVADALAGSGPGSGSTRVRSGEPGT